MEIRCANCGKEYDVPEGILFNKMWRCVCGSTIFEIRGQGKNWKKPQG